MSYYKAKKYEDACESFSAAAEIDSLNKRSRLLLMYNRGSVYFQLDCFEQARDDFTEGLRINTIHVKSLLKRAKAHRKLNEFKKSIVDCEMLMTLAPSEEVKQLMIETTNRLEFKTL